ncbi:MAG: WYL domain-containing transcriptional regulator [Prevotella sp.]|nr:WYL domain-containing transcriptional regulator [Prevotella sp.]
MRHNNLEKELSLILLMTENRDYTVQQMCDRLGISRRTLYYYIDFFRDSGFTVEKRGTCYSLDKTSLFFTRLFKKVHFTEDEALTMRRLLDRVNDNSLHVQNIKNKLTRLYDLDILESVTFCEREAENVSTLYDAIKMKKTVILRNYSSPHSNTTSNRIVEPFMFMNNNNDIRCYEIASGQNKTFKISRIESVVVLADDQNHEAHHKRVLTDIFMFSGEKRFPVKLRLGRLARNIMLEEYPQSAAYITPDDANHWILSLDVCSYLGISRFVLGLFESVEILGSEEFRDYIRMKIDNMKNP